MMYWQLCRTVADEFVDVGLVFDIANVGSARCRKVNQLADLHTSKSANGLHLINDFSKDTVLVL